MGQVQPIFIWLLKWRSIGPQKLPTIHSHSCKTRAYKIIENYLVMVKFWKIINLWGHESLNWALSLLKLCFPESWFQENLRPSITPFHRISNKPLKLASMKQKHILVWILWNIQNQAKTCFPMKHNIFKTHEKKYF